MSRQKEYTKINLSFDDLLRAGLGVPLKDAPKPEEQDEDEQPDRVAEGPPSPPSPTVPSPHRSRPDAEESTRRSRG